MLPLIELVALCETPDIGVCGGVVAGKDEFVAVTEGTEPNVGVGLLITPDELVAAWPADIDADEGEGLAGGTGPEPFADTGVGFVDDGDADVIGAGAGPDVEEIGASCGFS